jgi:hypothetical protein
MPDPASGGNTVAGQIPRLDIFRLFTKNEKVNILKGLFLTLKYDKSNSSL